MDEKISLERLSNLAQGSPVNKTQNQSWDWNPDRETGGQPKEAPTKVTGLWVVTMPRDQVRRA